MKIEELENKIKAFQNEIVKLQEEVEKLKAEKKSKKCRVGRGGYYYYIESNNLVAAIYEGYTKGDNYRYNIHNYFKTEEEAQAVADNKKTHIELMELAEKLNTEPIDWENCYQEKIYIGYCYGDKSIYQESVKQCKHSNTVYCTNENFKDEAIKRIGEERLIKYLKGI